jgi:hypothetical protein
LITGLVHIVRLCLYRPIVQLYYNNNSIMMLPIQWRFFF